MKEAEVKLYKTDYVLFKDNKPVGSLDIIYASESVIELFNDGFKLEQGEEFIKMTDLPIESQEKYIAERAHNKSILWIHIESF